MHVMLCEDAVPVMPHWPHEDAVLQRTSVTITSMIIRPKVPPFQLKLRIDMRSCQTSWASRIIEAAWTEWSETQYCLGHLGQGVASEKEMSSIEVVNYSDARGCQPKGRLFRGSTIYQEIFHVFIYTSYMINDNDYTIIDSDPIRNWLGWRSVAVFRWNAVFRWFRWRTKLRCYGYSVTPCSPVCPSSQMDFCLLGRSLHSNWPHTPLHLRNFTPLLGYSFQTTGRCCCGPCVGPGSQREGSWNPKNWQVFLTIGGAGHLNHQHFNDWVASFLIHMLFSVDRCCRHPNGRIGFGRQLLRRETHLSSMLPP